MLKINIQQCQNLLLFLNSVNLKGNEARALVELQMLITQEGQKLQAEAQASEQMSKKVAEKVAEKVVEKEVAKEVEKEVAKEVKTEQGSKK